MSAFKKIFLVCAFVVASLHSYPVNASTSNKQRVTGVTSFLLNKREAQKGEAVVATYQLTQPAKTVFVTATNYDGMLLGFSFPQTISTNVRRTAGVITFTIPPEAGSLSPLMLTLNIDGALQGLNTLRIGCDTPWFFTPRVDRCPFEPVTSSPAAVQHFERGAMMWLQTSNSIYVFFNEQNTGYAGNSFKLARFEDTFKDSMPESDPSYIAPAAKFQPIRGFGKVWRENPNVMNKLGWATDKEQGYSACYGYAFGGWKSMRSYVSTPTGELLELESYYRPTGWRELETIEGKPISITGCG